MLALSLAVGLLIDDAIVVIENIYRHLSYGKKPAVAAFDATSEIALAVLATTLTIIVVFVPVAFMKGIVGQFFYAFGITVAMQCCGVVVRGVYADADVLFALAEGRTRIPPGDQKSDLPIYELVERDLREAQCSFCRRQSSLR